MVVTKFLENLWDPVSESEVEKNWKNALLLQILLQLLELIHICISVLGGLTNTPILP